MRRLVIVLSVAVLVFGAVSFAGATSVDFEIGADNWIKSPDNLKFEYNIYGTLPGFKFSLEEGQTTDPFNYALVKNIISGDDDEYNITGFLDFDLPAGISVDNPVANPGTFKITSANNKCGKGGCKKNGNAILTFQSVDVPFGFENSGLFTVQLYGFNVKWSDKCCSSSKWTKTITATVTLTKAPNQPSPVPEPSTLLLLGSGILGAAVFLRRRRN